MAVGDASWRGLRRRQWQEGALKSKPGQIGKGLHPAHGTQRRAPGGSGVLHIKVLGSRLPCSLHLLNVTSGSGFAPAQNLSHVGGFFTWKTG